MYKFASSLLPWLVLFCIIICCAWTSTAFTCIHDGITILKRPKSLTRSILKYQDVKEERENDPSLFEPVAIHFYIDQLDASLPLNVIHSIEMALKDIRDFVSKTVRARKRKRPFLLERSGCTRRWQFGKNKGKCSRFSNEPEACSAKDTMYIIPSRFLDKMEVYDAIDDISSKVHFSPGAGLLDSNFIIFVTSKATSLCNGKDVYAYGTYCRLDRKTNQPLAGILNLCPSYFVKKLYPAHHYYNVLMHEVIHILGFSQSLFEKFQPCKKGVYCNIPRNVIQSDSMGLGRLIYPQVVENMKLHFECNNNTGFGAPMAADAPKDNTTNEIVYSSHFHPLLMYSSIMTPRFTETDEVFVDNITLAVLASTGWYAIDYTQADKFEFGKGEGCNFGDINTCGNSSYICDPQGSPYGCDVSREFIGKCVQIVKYHPCGVYQPVASDDCNPPMPKEHGLDLHALGYQQKCFVINGENTSTSACLSIKCKSTLAYDVLVNMTWYACDDEAEVKFDSNSTVVCPDSFMFCKDFKKPERLSMCPSEKSFFIAVRMQFGNPSFNDLLMYNNFKNFKVSTITGIASQIGIPTNYISNATLYMFKKVILDFMICPPSHLDPSELSRIVKNTQEFLDDGNFYHIFKGAEDLVVASSDMKIDPEDVIAFSDYEGLSVLLLLPIICGILIAATFIASLVRLYLIQKHRPRRTGETSLEDNVADQERSTAT